MLLFKDGDGTGNGTADGNGGPQRVVRGGLYNFSAWGTFGSGNVTLQYEGEDGSGWITFPNSAIDANSGLGVLVHANAMVRAVISNSTSPALKASLNFIRE